MGNKTEIVRNELHSLLNKKSYNFLDADVLKKSQELDKQINTEMIKKLKGSVNHERIYS